MDKNDQERFKAALVGTAEIYGKEVTPELTKIYWAILKELTIDEFSDAMAEHLRDVKTGKFFPKPADILEKAKGTEHQRYLARIHDIHNTDW